MLSAELPPLDDSERARTAEIALRIRARARERGGWLPFSQFMQMALYEPGLGYYMAEHPIFGPAGDYVTAPELSPLFTRCIATVVADVLRQTDGGDIVELGAGSGRLAADLAAALARLGALPRRYRIVEPSPVLALRQRRLLESVPEPSALAGRVEWLDAPPAETWHGVAIANEVLDALPVDRFRIAGPGCEALGVSATASGFEWQPGPADASLAAAVAMIQARLPEPMPDGFVSEWRPGQREWLARLARGLGRGAILISDYGLPRAQYYHASRDGGTLCGFRRHRRVDDALADPGAQDLTAWADFSALADDARACRLEIAGFTTQAHFLLATGIEREFARLVEDESAAASLAHRQRAATLLLPGEMGERFKILALARGLARALPGFDFRDLSASL